MKHQDKTWIKAAAARVRQAGIDARIARNGGGNKKRKVAQNA